MGWLLTTTGVVDDLLYDTPDVSIALSLCPLALRPVCFHFGGVVCGRTYEVERAELRGGLVQAGVGREDGSATLTLVANYPTHGDGVVVRIVVGRCRRFNEMAYCCVGAVSELLSARTTDTRLAPSPSIRNTTQQ